MCEPTPTKGIKPPSHLSVARRLTSLLISACFDLSSSKISYLHPKKGITMYGHLTRILGVAGRTRRPQHGEFSSASSPRVAATMRPCLERHSTVTPGTLSDVTAFSLARKA